MPAKFNLSRVRRPEELCGNHQPIGKAENVCLVDQV